MSTYDYDDRRGNMAQPGSAHQPHQQQYHEQYADPRAAYDESSSKDYYDDEPLDQPRAYDQHRIDNRKHRERDDDDNYYDDHDDRGDDDDDDDSYVDDDEFEDEEDQAREAERMRKKKKKQATVYDIEDTRDYADDSDDDDDDSQNPKKRDFWGREQRNCCDCCRNCLTACLRGFCIPPACDLRRCCECPHGWCYTTMGVVLGIGGIVMSCMYIISCDVERIVILYNGEKPPNAPRIGYGFIARGVSFGDVPTYMNCIKYTDQEKATVFDGWMHTARFFLFLSTAFGIIGAIVLFLTICIAWSPNTFEHWLMWNYVFAALSIPMSYMLFGSPLCDANECKLGEGGVQCISIFLFWLTCANTVKSFPAAMPPDEDEDESDEGEDNDDLWYETEEDMWNDRLPPPRNRENDENRGLTDDMEPEYLDDDYDDEYDESSRFTNDRLESERPYNDHYGADDDDESDRRRGQVQHYDESSNNDPSLIRGDTGYYDPNDSRMYDDDDGSHRQYAAAAPPQGQGRDPYYASAPRQGGGPEYHDPYQQGAGGAPPPQGDYYGHPPQQHPGRGAYDDDDYYDQQGLQRPRVGDQDGPTIT